MGFYATKLTNLFLQPINTEEVNANVQTKDIKPKDKFSWIASILLNITSVSTTSLILANVLQWLKLPYYTILHDKLSLRH